jgi:hypothetical protein
MNGRRRFTRSLDLSFFNSSFWLTNIPVHLYSPLRVLRRSILTALMRPLPFSYFTIQCYERLRFVVTRDYISIWIIQPAVRFYRRYEWTAEVYSFSRSLDVSIFNCSFWLTNIPVHLYSPLRVLRRSILTALMLPFHFSYFTIQCYERLHFDVTRDYKTMLREITFVFELYNPP